MKLFTWKSTLQELLVTIELLMHKNSSDKPKNNISEDVINQGFSIEDQEEPTKVGHMPNPYNVQPNPY